jgi:hypothetical protein
MAAVLPLQPTDSVAGTIVSPGDVDSFQVTIPDSGRLTAGVQVGTGIPLQTRLSLLDSSNNVLVQSDGQSAANPGDQITQDVLAGTYLLEVTGLGSGTGSFTLTTDFQQATSPDQPLAVNFNHAAPWTPTPGAVVTGDFTGDGHLDLATADYATKTVSVQLGLGDGTFQSTPPVLLGNGAGSGPYSIVAGNFDGRHYANGKPILDLVVNDLTSNTFSVLLGNGNGTFQPAKSYAAGTDLESMVAADLTGNGHLDLVIVHSKSNVAGDPNGQVAVWLGNGDGTFQPGGRYDVGNAPKFVAVDDFDGRHYTNGQPILDLAVTNYDSSDISILLGNGDGTGTFRPQLRVPTGTGTNPVGIVTGDFNGDGHLDLATANFGSNNVSVLLGKGDGTFPSQKRFAAGAIPFGLVTGDFDGRHYANGQPILDLAVANQHSNDVSVLLGNGDGTFKDQVRYEVGYEPWVIVTGDFNEDGHLDLATANVRSHDVSLLLGLGNGTFQPDLANPRPGQTNPLGMLVGDFNHDGIPDLATVDYTGGDLFIFQGRGDGTFQERQRLATGATSVGLISADVNGDGILDLITANCFSSDVSILLGNGDGTFQPATTYPASHFCQWVVAGDFDGRLDTNGKPVLDLVTGGDLDNDLSILYGHVDATTGLPDGTFDPPVVFGSASTRGPAAVVGDFDGRHHANGQPILDLAIANASASGNAVSLFLGQDDATANTGANAAPPSPGQGDATAKQGDPFRDPVLNFPVPPVLDANGKPILSRPVGLVADDFGNGHLDLAVTDAGSDDVSVLLGNGDGTFQLPVRYAVGTGPDSIVAGDFNGDGHLDLAVTNGGSTFVSVLLGKGDGTFEPQLQSTVTDTPPIHNSLAVGDFNGDGHLDLTTAQMGTSDISVLLGNGDGTFQASIRFAVGLGQVAAVSGDFSNSGRRDVASVNPTTNEVAVALGAGDGTLQAPLFYPVGAAPDAIVTGDFNGDGRLDLAVANFASNDVSVLLGLGDGTFQAEQRYAVGKNPTGIVAGDFDGDGHLDLAVTNAGSNDISILQGNGDGTFQPDQPKKRVELGPGKNPSAIVAGDFGNGHIDLATANYRTQDVTVFLGRGHGTFEAPVSYPLGTAPVALIAAHLTGADGPLDLVTANFRSSDVSVLLGRGDGTFQAAVRYEAGDNPVAVVAGDFNNDGHLDLATADGTDNADNAVALLVGNGHGSFEKPVQRHVAAYPRALVADDFNNDGRTDLAVASQFARDVSVLMGLGDANGTFLSPDTISNEIHATPLVRDLNGDGTPDVAVLNHAGQILLRYGRPDAPGTFEPPVVINPDPRYAARELALVRTGSGVELAALDAGDSGLSFYSRGADGAFIRTAGPTVPGFLPVRLAAGDLNGDGRDDLVVAATGSNQVFVYLQHADGSFGLQPADGSPGPSPNYRVGVGVNPSAISLTDMDGDGRLDIVVTNQFSGDVSVLLNDLGNPFGSELRFRAGIGLYWVDQRANGPVIHSFQGSAGVVSGLFDDGKTPDLVVTNSGANSFSLLRGTGLGGFLNPQTALTYSTGVRPTGVVAGHFTHDGNLDLAILNEGSQDISIFLGDGHGHFTPKGTVSAGNAPTGLALADVNGDGIPDLLVGNQFGDVLVLLGNGDGTFQPYQRTDGHMALAIADLKGNGQQDFIFADAGLDRVNVQYPQPGQSFTQDRSDGILAPGAVEVADVGGTQYLVVANSGANDVVVYRIVNGQPDTDPRTVHTYFAGTDPVGITVADVNQDGIPDVVVANEGSNDVSILLGQGSGSDWTLVPGPRLRAGAGPVSTAVADRTGHGIPDLVVTNSQSNNVYVLPGVGHGFFNDQNPLVLNTGLDPQQAIPGDFTGDGKLDLVAVNAGSNDLTFFRDFGPGIRIASGGDTPVAALAGDFLGNGIDDLLVANNGDGRITLLDGGLGGPLLAQTFSLAGVPHPSALALAGSKDGLDVYVVEEGREAAVLLTTFGIAVPAASNPRQVPALADVFVVNGPGFAIGVDVLSPPAEFGGLVAGPAGGEPAQPASTLPPLEGVLAAVLIPVQVDGGPEQSPGSAPPADPALTDFMMGLEDAFRQLRDGGFPGRTEPTPPPVESSPDVLERAFQDWRPARGVPGNLDLWPAGTASAEPWKPAPPRWFSPRNTSTARDHEDESSALEEQPRIEVLREHAPRRLQTAADVLVAALIAAGVHPSPGSDQQTSRRRRLLLGATDSAAGR